MNHFDAYLLLAAQVHALLHPGRYVATLSYSDEPLCPVVCKVSEPAVDKAFHAAVMPSSTQLAELECPGHAERFGVIVAHDLLRQLNEHAVAKNGCTYRGKKRGEFKKPVKLRRKAG